MIKIVIIPEPEKKDYTGLKMVLGYLAGCAILIAVYALATIM